VIRAVRNPPPSTTMMDASARAGVGEPGHALSDEGLARRARDGDSGAMVQLYRRYAAEIHRFAVHNVGTEQDAEDVASETFLRMVRNLEGFAGRSSFRTWLYAIAHNCVNDHWRRNGRHEAEALDPERAFAAPELVSAEEPERPSAATAFGRAVLAQLPDRYRTVLQLRIIDGRTVRDTAEEMHMTVGNVKVLQYRALKQAARIAQEVAKTGESHG
jgi:RNA polymerase sigma-70 factor (ECF subfamily)